MAANESISSEPYSLLNSNDIIRRFIPSYYYKSFIVASTVVGRQACRERWRMGGREQGEGGEGARGGSEEAMMWGEGGSGSGGRVEEGNE